MVPEGAADYLLAFEKLEACRWAHYLHSDGVAVVNDQAIPTLALAATTPPIRTTRKSPLFCRSGRRRIGYCPPAKWPWNLGNQRVANVILIGRALLLPGDSRRGMAGGHRQSRAAQSPRTERGSIRIGTAHCQRRGADKSRVEQYVPRGRVSNANRSARSSPSSSGSKTNCLKKSRMTLLNAGSRSGFPPGVHQPAYLECLSNTRSNTR